jgi:AcrR family transcriptional regulator
MNKVNRQKRQTISTLRQRQAQATSDMIVAAAKEQFLTLGYGGTTIEAIATKAGVGISTVYAVFGSKRGILRAIRNAWHERSHIREVINAKPDQVGAVKRLQQLAEATRLQWETGVDVITIYNGAATADPEAAEELAQALIGRRDALETFVSGIAPYLRNGLEPARASAILQALSLPEVYQQLVRISGLSPDDYQSWLKNILIRELLEKREDLS